MKVNELRIGNLVEVYNPKYHKQVRDKTLIVVGIEGVKEKPIISLINADKKENYCRPYLNQDIKYIKPIPLTEEWLFKFGFNKGKHLTPQNYNNDIVRVYKWMTADVYIFSIFKYRTPDRLNINYVHQLQNLYFAITGKELELK